MTLEPHSSIRGLYATPPTPLPFLDGVVVRSFILVREAGNVIVYNAPGITTAAREILDLGEPERLLVTHWHEGIYPAPTLAVPIFVHEADSGQTSLPIAGTFSKQERIGGDLMAIPMPGHTIGTTMFLWENGEQHLLFPGDSIWVQGGEWRAVLLGESDREAYIDSLLRLMAIEFDVLVPWGSEDSQPYAYAVTHAEARENLREIVERLQAGEYA